MPRGGTPSQGLWMPPRVATLFVAAYDSLDKCRAQADYICDGVADEVQINAALAAVNAIGGGRVVLSEGRFVLAASIVIPGNSITIEGQGRSTEIDGDALLTGAHAIAAISREYSVIKNLVVHTSIGIGKTCHCIYLENPNFAEIDGVDITGSDSDGIRLAGATAYFVYIKRCYIYDVDDSGINIITTSDSAQCHIFSNMIEQSGIHGIIFSSCPASHFEQRVEHNYILYSAQHGIHGEMLKEGQILGNFIEFNTSDGIYLDTDSDNNQIEDNFISSNGGYGINIAAATCGENRAMNNKLIGNVAGAIQDAGVYTQLPEIFIPVPNPSSNIGAHPCEQLTDGLEVVSRFNVCIPLNFQEMVSCHAVVVPGGTGNMRRSVATDWGEIASGESYNIDSGAVAEGNVAVTGTQVEGIDIAAAFVGVGALGPGDIVGVAFTRHADDVLDTVDADCWLLGIRMRYV